MAEGGVRFIRVRGRIVPVRDDGGGKGGKGGNIGNSGKNMKKASAPKPSTPAAPEGKTEYIRFTMEPKPLSRAGIATRQVLGTALLAPVPILGSMLGNEWARSADSSSRPQRKAMHANSTAGALLGAAAGAAGGALLGLGLGAVPKLKRDFGIAYMGTIGAAVGSSTGLFYGQAKGYERARNVKDGAWFKKK